MESLMKLILLFTLIFGSLHCIALEKVVGNLYFKNYLGHLHKNPSRGSSSLTTIQCAYPVKVLDDTEKSAPEGWVYAKVGDDRGFIQSGFLDIKRPDCFQEKYPNFYLNLNLDLTDMYYWGRLNDQYLLEESKTQ
jgi:hypothetical protein